MGLKDKTSKGSRWRKTFVYAWQGLMDALGKEKNLQFHFVFASIMVVCSFIFSISRTEWLFVILSIFGVIALELMNTAVERVVDLVTKEYHPLAKQAKDIAAASVLVYAFMSVIIGLVIFLPKVIQLFEKWLVF
ncbi:diacylglycerol kinase family protein [Heyndrickxia acidicola]|uniref:Diacylglycerol kinase family protein n=1 Tax=Heyndrickxia acidicola TaxID=209389 RepID=A0ABU6MK93_9BACI|nr:diacylglycerol kinase family protein [Heyndrickxia acidicola]MED1205096.1 diacylglycerol kinase family protein [Heyndrickxia acidicola]